MYTRVIKKNEKSKYFEFTSSSRRAKEKIQIQLDFSEIEKEKKDANKI